MKTAGEVLIDNGLAFQAAKWYDQLIGAMEEYAQLYSAGEEVYDVAISELDTNAVNWRGATVVLAEHFERVAENISDRITHQPVSEEEIESIILSKIEYKERKIYSLNTTESAKAIKELLNR